MIADYLLYDFERHVYRVSLLDAF